MTARMFAPTPTTPVLAVAPLMATVAPLAADALEPFRATPEVAMEAAMLMATETAPGDASAAASEMPDMPEAALPPVARLLILLGALLLIISGVLFFIGTFRARL
jgi:hypothetical protein